jgi:FOG: WD40-like repeat
VIDDMDNVKAFGLSTGAILWEQKGLKLRQLSSPVESKGRVVMGDFEGYLHILDSKDGRFIGRKKISNKPIKELSSSGNDIIALDSSGRLFFLSLR